MGKWRTSSEFSERKRADERLRAIVEGTAAKTGVEFFRSLAHSLALALGVKFVFVGELDPAAPDSVRTLAFWIGDGFREDFTYDLAHTPCAEVVSGSLCCFPKGVRQLFTKDRFLIEMGVESYLGTPLFDDTGLPLGLLVAMDDRPMDEDPQGQDLMRIFAARAGAELVRQRAEMALRESEGRSRTIIETTLDAVIAIDEQSIVTGWNRHAEEIFGWSAAEAIGRSITDLIIPTDLHAQHLHGVEAYLATGDGPLVGKRVELEGVHKSGRKLPIELSIAALRSSGSYEFNAFVRDLSERKRAETARRRLDSEVQYTQKLESLGVLAGGIAHDFNNLLTGILGSAAIAKRELPANHDVQHHLDEVLTGANLAAHLTAQLLDYAGRGQVESRPVDLSAEVRGVQGLLRTAIIGRARLSFDLSAGLAAIEADAPQLHQVLMNLVINAAESSPDEVEIGIETHQVELLPRELSDLVPGSPIDPGPCVALDVEDDGCGLDEELKQRVFDPFFTTKATGRGLGLAAMLGIVHRHGGGIRLRSSPGIGSQFRILFPALDVHIGSIPEAEAEELTGSGRVLAVDDDEYVLSAVRSMLENSGYSVVTARSGVEAIAIYREHHADIDVVLLDIIMPGMDGEETFVALRGIRPDVRVLLSTGLDTGEVARRFAEDELAGALRKPYAPEQLVRALESLLAKERVVDPDNDFESRFSELQAAYRSKLPGLLGELATAVRLARAEQASEERCREAWRLAHRLKGTAGSYRLQEPAAALEIAERMLWVLIGPAEAAEADWDRIDAALTRAVAACEST